MQILTVEQMRNIERKANANGLSYAQMMHNAGHAAANEIMTNLILAQNKQHIVLLIGPGNNGGDGLVCAAALHDAHLHNLNIYVYIFKSTPQNALWLATLRTRNIVLIDGESDTALANLKSVLNNADIIIDALLGTGVARPISGALQSLLQMVAQQRAQPNAPFLIALDGPTGMNYDTGAVDPYTVTTDLTLSFHALKRGHMCHPAAAACGKIVVVPIGIAVNNAVASDVDTEIERLDTNWLKRHLPKRRDDANKGAHGRVWVIGGCDDYIGAPALAATAAYRVGAGLVTLSVPASIKMTIAMLCPEATFCEQMASSEGLNNVKTLLVGPGLGQSTAAQQRLHHALNFAQAQFNQLNGCVLDADALNIWAAQAELGASVSALSSKIIITPHPGEMARLMKISVAEVQSDRIGNALKLAEAYQIVVVLKGAHTVIAAPQGRADVLPFNNPALAVAGTGDVLAGTIAGMSAQGLGPFEAACCGAYLHGLAGEHWRSENSEAGLLASDLLPLLPKMLRNKP